MLNLETRTSPDMHTVTESSKISVRANAESLCMTVASLGKTMSRPRRLEGCSRILSG